MTDDVPAAAQNLADRRDGVTVAQVLGYYLLDPEEHAATVARALDEYEPSPADGERTTGGVDA